MASREENPGEKTLLGVISKTSYEKFINVAHKAVERGCLAGEDLARVEHLLFSAASLLSLGQNCKVTSSKN